MFATCAVKKIRNPTTTTIAEPPQNKSTLKGQLNTFEQVYGATSAQDPSAQPNRPWRCPQSSPSAYKPSDLSASNSSFSKPSLFQAPHPYSAFSRAVRMVALRASVSSNSSVRMLM